MRTQKILLFVFTFSLFLNIHNSLGQANPLFSSKPVKTDTSTVSDTITDKHTAELEPAKKRIGLAVFSQFIRKNASFQRDIKKRFFNLAKDYKAQKSLRGVLLIFMLSFFYGILHSLGPGHGKVFIFSYILVERPKVMTAISTSYLIAFIHAVSGLIVALIIVFTLNTFSSSSAKISDASNLIMSFSFALLTLVGISLFVKTLRNKNHHKHNLPDNKQIIPFILSVGLVPCPGTIIIVTFLASLGLLYLGLLSVVFIIIGMGFTISVIALISLFSKKLVLKLSSGDTQAHEKTYRYFSIAGACLLVLFGLWFFIGSLFPA